MRIGITEIFVEDQDHAVRFYTDVVGFVVTTDAAYGDDGRWITVVSPEQPDGPELLLAPMTDAARALQASRAYTGSPALSLTTDDCRRSYEELCARGATFRSGPERHDHGGIDAVFEDGCGNLINIHQPAEAAR